MRTKVKAAFALGLGIVWALPAVAETSCRVSKAQYDALQSDSSYSQVVSVLGCHGEELSSTEMAGFKTVMLMWTGNSFGGNMNVMFQNGRMMSKAQFGLK
ncbi:MAG TPA: hypothetical protein VL202_00375 [Pararhizobium sp.]|uniref:hypothetical protein n=1 Tax=Pararhizobium sp. TaxID=1977563 RepID=UPI002C27DD6A|nr:hypothetical protein [Pararhizobium sp.]HTO29625.1 hypothetical protein [Pararhizobium sp.]